MKKILFIVNPNAGKKKSSAEDIRQALLDEKEVRMTYDKQWYWKLKASTYKTKEQLNDERAAAKVSVTITDAPVSPKNDDDDDDDE